MISVSTVLSNENISDIKTQKKHWKRTIFNCSNSNNNSRFSD